ncbi:DUF411 domain-containing protein [Thalassotalea sp. LPB0316]|uniref:DUF411 domain-containing protein n=1 Tax=Thalassotalea sp. LPB0316 TaxID=2769490 RepID=UPI0018691D5F|nr:DUF411 domain-containing protein [Thalassotalea sp. LPB0316]QOL25651.1 DUF411 domain-containing protein [Thalassotalea sp. LPB0316]
MKILFKLAMVLLYLPMLAHSETTPEIANELQLFVHKTPTCGCCKKWLHHLEQQGITATGVDHQDLGTIKQQYGVLPQYRSCHTAVSQQGFFFEGHVPAKFIRHFLTSPLPDAIGLSVPAMPVGSPGMEVGDNFMPYRVLVLFSDGSSRVFARVNNYQEQF